MIAGKIRIIQVYIPSRPFTDSTSTEGKTEWTATQCRTEDGKVATIVYVL